MGNSIADFRRMFYGNDDAEYQFLKDANAQGVTAQSLLTLGNGTFNPADGGVNIQSGGVNRIVTDATGIGFFAKAPVARPAAIADPVAPGAIYVQAEAAATRNAVVSLISALEALGLITTV